MPLLICFGLDNYADVFINSFNHATPALEVTDLPAIDQNDPLDSLLCTEEVFEMLSTLVTTKSKA